ncbi:MAG: hypothetical protein WCP15_01605 [bacterium]
MSHFNQIPEFERELKKLSKKYRSLPHDLKDFEDILRSDPCGVGKGFVIIHSSPACKIVKARLACESLQNKNMRIIYAYHKDRIEFMYIELYSKSEKANEDKGRIMRYLEAVIN